MTSAVSSVVSDASALALSDGITAHASRAVFVQPDRIEATILLTTPITVTQQQAAGILENAGLPSRLVSASTDQSLALFDRGAQSFSYTFAHSSTGSDLIEITHKLEVLRTARSTTVTHLSYGTSLTASASLIEDEFKRALPLLIEDARKRAELIASAGGLQVGAVRSVTEGEVGLAKTLQLTFSVAVKFALE